MSYFRSRINYIGLRVNILCGVDDLYIYHLT